MIRLAKLFAVIEEGGVVYWPYFVAYQKQPIKFRVIQVDENLWKQEVSQWRRRIVINLWLVVLEFDWLTKEHYES